jgi:antitoxin component YwqK of YwqJK toxin-antitoxin module
MLQSFNSIEKEILQESIKTKNLDSWIFTIIENYIYEKVVDVDCDDYKQTFIRRFGNIHGKYLEYFENGNICIEENYNNGLEEGERREYFSNGQLFQFSNWLNDEMNGLCLTYYQNGQLRCQKVYHNDQLHGEEKVWSENGILIKIAHYENGEVQGEVKNYYPTGEIKSIQHFRNSRPHGHCTQFYKSGIQELTKHYDLGSLTFLQRWNEDGNLIEEEEYYMGDLHGDKIVYDNQGQVIIKEKYRNGKLIN